MFLPRQKSAHHVPLGGNAPEGLVALLGGKGGGRGGAEGREGEGKLDHGWDGLFSLKPRECVRLRSGHCRWPAVDKNIARAADHVTGFLYEVSGKSKRYAVGSVLVRKCRKGSARSPGKDTHINTWALNVYLPVLARRLPTPHFCSSCAPAIGTLRDGSLARSIRCRARNICTQRPWRASYSWR